MIQSKNTKLHELVMRIPGSWASEAELSERLPNGCHLQGDRLTTEAGWVELHARKADDMFPSVFQGACVREPTADERRTIENYQTNVCLLGPSGSPGAALYMMRCARAVLRAGGAGVFIDNCAISHGASHWLELSDAAVSDERALLYAFVHVVRSGSELYSLGAQALGYPDTSIRRGKDESLDADTLIELHRAALLGTIFSDGDLFESPRRVRLRHRSARRFPVRSPIHNVFGEWHLEPAD